MSVSQGITYWLYRLASVALLAYAVYRYLEALAHRPRFAKTDIRFQEWFASGCSQKNILTKMGGGHNCVRIVVTHDLLWITSWFPFSLLAPLYDMEHVIPLGQISSVERRRFLWSNTLLLTYVGAANDRHTVRVIPRNIEQFVSALHVDPLRWGLDA